MMTYSHHRFMKTNPIGAMAGVVGCLVFVCGTLMPKPVDGAEDTSSPVPSHVLEAQAARVAVIERISRSTIAVFGTSDESGGGSAVVITPDGYALTNFHVTKPIGHHLRCGMNDGVLYDAVIVGVDPTGDVALIKLLGRDDFPAATLGDSDKVQVGDWCIVSGNPFLLATDFHPTVTYGIVSGVHRYQYPAGTLLEYADCIQTDAAINPGNSGGPLWNAAGQLIGINGRGSFEKRGRVNVGVGYAISINQIKNFMGYLRSGRVVDHATLGATVTTDVDGRVVVSNILQSSDAYRRGLRYGDEIVSFGGRSITTTNAFKNVLGIYPKAWRVPLTYARDDQHVDIWVRLAGVHRNEELLAKMNSGGLAPPTPKPQGPDSPQRPGKDRGTPPKSEPEAPPHEDGPLPAKDAEAETAKKVKAVEALYEARRGFANYYFNRLQQSQIWAAQPKSLNDTSDGAIWRLAGKTEDGQPFELSLGPQLAQGRLRGVFEQLDFGRELSEQREPRRSGGLLLALHQWRRWLALGPEQFGEVYYLGTMPLIDTELSCDVLVGTYDALETRFYFHRDTHQLIALELFPDAGVDPCELRFEWQQQDPDAQFPALTNAVATAEPAAPLVIAVRWGDDPFDRLSLNAIQIQQTGNRRAANEQTANGQDTSEAGANE